MNRLSKVINCGSLEAEDDNAVVAWGWVHKLVGTVGKGERRILLL
jgi:hypothetical protein